MRIAVAALAASFTILAGAQGQALLKPGEYLRSDYMGSIQSTHSPHASCRMNEVQLVIVSVESEENRLQEILNFHEGGAIFGLLPSGTVRIVESAGEDEADVSVTVLSDNRFSIAYKGRKPELFTNVGSVDAWVAANTIVGEYRDKEGGVYTFGTDGVARFPDKTFKFTVGVDHVLQPFDHLYGGGFWWAYRIKGDSLKIFDTKGELNMKMESKPLFVLSRQHKPGDTAPKKSFPRKRFGASGLKGLGTHSPGLARRNGGTTPGQHVAQHFPERDE
ncbi:MAG: hypothetical protein IT364_11890 [Candidatus Hydrogenedentes bacterium]|nr:hypothetical protein [Candidatus Hydrogenedentota bacterium]